MAVLVNNSQRPVSIGGKLLSPHIAEEVNDSYLQTPRVKKLMEEKRLARAEGGASKAAPGQARAQVAVRPRAPDVPKPS